MMTMMKTMTKRHMRYLRMMTWVMCWGQISMAFAHGGKHAPKKERGVVGLDAYAQGQVIDVLITSEKGKKTVLEHSRSTDGGQSWQPAHVIPHQGVKTYQRINDPQIAAAGKNLVVIWTSEIAGVPGPLVSAFSSDEGKTWQLGAPPADDGKKGAHEFVDVISDEQGIFHAIWLDGRSGSTSLYSAASRDQGKTWSKNELVAANTCECCWTKLYALWPGERQVLFRDREPRDMVLASQGASDKAWHKQSVVGAFGWQIKACPEVGGALALGRDGKQEFLHSLVWTGKDEVKGLYALRSVDRGQTWSKPYRLSDKAKHNAMAVQGQQVLVVWDAIADDGGRAVFSVSSADNGQSWQAPVRLSDAGKTAAKPLVHNTDKGFVVLWTESQKQGPSRWRAKVVPIAKLLPASSPSPSPSSR